MKYSNVEELPVWIKAHQLTLRISKFSDTFPKSEIFSLTSQIRRSTSSVPANISEGFYRKSTKELIQFIYNAIGSQGESIYHLRLSEDLGYIDEKTHDDLRLECENISKQINGWLKSLKSKL